MQLEKFTQLVVEHINSLSRPRVETLNLLIRQYTTYYVQISHA